MDPQPLPNSYVETLTLSVAVFGDGASQGVIKIRRGYKGGALIPQD